jgi:uncharacterized phiE125 gp8 family phage protein
MVLPYPPLVSVTSVKYLNQSAVLTTVDPVTYFIDSSEPGMIRRGYNTVYPEVQYGAPNGVVIEYVAGYGAASAVPVDIVHAIKLLIADYFDNRGEIVVGTISTRIPNHVKNLLHDYRMYDFAN